MSSPWKELLPTSLEVCGAEYEIRSDYRAVLDICAAMSDQELSDQERQYAALDILYQDFEGMPQEHYQSAIQRCIWFLNGGEKPQEGNTVKLVDWEQDFRIIVAPINRVMGQEVRAAEYIHWWTFLSAYMEIGDCLFAQVVRVRDKQAKGIALDKSEQKFYRSNRDIVDLKNKYTKEDDELLRQLGIG